MGDDKNQGSTDWLTTTVSVAALAGQEVTLLFAVWDSSDGVLDTTVLVDNVHWTFASAPDGHDPAARGDAPHGAELATCSRSAWFSPPSCSPR